MVPNLIRLRHPGGVSTLQLDFDSMTVQDLQQEIFAASQILPSEQELKSGYPPQSLIIVPELPLSSLGLRHGEQIIVSQKVGASARGPSPPSIPKSSTSTPSIGSASAGFSSSFAPPANSNSPPTSLKLSGKPDSVRTEGGFLVHRIVPDDNSCLFSSVALVFEQDMMKAQNIRKIVADGIRNDMETYNEAILGRPREEYISTILKPATWGGAIELSVLATHYNTEISSIDVETGRIDRFEPTGEGASGNRCILVYSGIHYDAATLSPIEDAPSDFHQTVFPILSGDKSDPTLAAAQKLADILRQKKAFTNTSTFDLKCEDCGQGLVGEKGARAHAKETGHVKFGEY